METYPLFVMRDLYNLIKTFETDLLVVRESQIEKASKPPRQSYNVIAILSRRQIDDLLQHP